MHQKPKLPMNRINPGPHARKGMPGKGGVNAQINLMPVGGSGSAKAKIMPPATKPITVAKAKNNPIPAAKKAAYGAKVKIGDLKS